MTKFKFQMATLLRLREATRDERRTELAEAYRVDDLLRSQLEGVVRELDWSAQQRRKVARPGTVDVDRLADAQRYELVVRSRQRELIGQREAVAGEIERRRQTLLAADREVRVLEKLREKQLERHRHEEGRREIKQLDEAARLCAVREEEP